MIRMFGGDIYAGLDFGGTKCASALIDRHGRLVAFSELPIRTTWSTRDLERLGRSMLEQLCAQRHTTVNRIRACGIGIPGPVRDGRILAAPNLPAIQRFDPKHLLPRARRVIKNDAVCALYAEHLLGHLATSSKGILIMLGTGCGSAIIERIDSRHTKNPRITGIEIGHICASISSATQETSRSPYELEAFCGQTFFRRRTKRSIDALLLQANAYDEETLRLFEAFGAHIGALTATMETLFQPDHIVIGGGLSRAYRFFAPTMRRVHALRRFPQSSPISAISASSFGPELGAYGAALLARDTLHD